jgi:hypothetical protein
MIGRFNILFMPDSVLPVQFFETKRRPAQHTPEMRLLWAVFEEALQCVAGGPTSASSESAKYREASVAHDWFMAVQESRGDPFTFPAICAIFGLAESPIRAYVDAQFQRLTPPKRKGQPVRSIRVSPTARLNKTRRAQHLPAFLPLIEIREPGHPLRRLSLHEYQETEDLARHLGREYIATDAWRGPV